MSADNLGQVLGGVEYLDRTLEFTEEPKVFVAQPFAAVDEHESRLLAYDLEGSLGVYTQPPAINRHLDNVQTETLENARCGIVSPRARGEKEHRISNRCYTHKDGNVGMQSGEQPERSCRGA